ncbi:AAA family ATPase [Nocardia veterana]|uniref:AAA family ATPase n=3 Tax=Nocardia veterana TaxID=132249 RepID=UPI0028A0EA2C|nr:AAA family ATPase [Nocardia veterana]
MGEGQGEVTPHLRELVSARLHADSTVSPDVAQTVLAALGEALEPGAAIERTGIFLSAIRVRGFRGIGREAVLRLAPGPGLTLVVGRNGSGKSSFAEAAELALTGANRRWEGRSAIWREGWRNMHCDSTSRIAVEMVAQESGAISIVREWDEGDDLSGGRWTERRVGHEPDEFRVGDWARAFELYRPFLSYSELGAVVDGRPSDLFDALHRLLGLDDISAALDRTRTRRIELERAAKHCRDGRQDLLEQLRAVADDRAERVAELLRAAPPDLNAISHELTGVRHDPGGVAALQAIARLRIPDTAQVEAAAAAVEQATAALIDLATGDLEAELRVVDLLRRAGEHAGVADACPCPVCGAGMLDTRWREAAAARIAAAERRSAALTAARERLGAAVARARALIEPVPPELDSIAAAPNIDPADARRAWAAWAALLEVEADTTFTARLRGAHADLAVRFDALQGAVHKELDRIDAVWTPLVPRIAAWLQEARLVAAADAELRTVRRAEEWLKSAAAGLRDERMAPLADHARRIWGGLRQRSNVDLGAIRLQGNAGASRKVLLDVTVDDSGATALGVMSQGELHTLGLALFLPRATVADSPFRFVMIDDPVQAMDPAKVDGLARVLSAVARGGRQVVVFTHDERLAESVRRLRVAATILEVQRRERSRVEVRGVEDPVQRYLSDARALVRTRQLPRPIATELVITCCRSAIEAAALARARRELLAAGVDHREVQRRVDRARTTWETVSLAIFGVPDRVDDLNELLDREAPWARSVVRDATAGAHIRIRRSPGELISGTRKFVTWLDS